MMRTVRVSLRPNLRVSPLTPPVSTHLTANSWQQPVRFARCRRDYLRYREQHQVLRKGGRP
jgi:hypothetical protein